MASKLTSYSSATPGSGGIVNDVLLTYNSFGQLITDSQSHSGAVVPGTTPMVQYAYANGSTNTIRPTTLTYPNGRAITTSYGTSGGINDSASRVDGLVDGTTTLVNYAYLGVRQFVQTTYPQPNIQYTLLGSSSGNSPAGDIYWGLDLFGRIIDSRWFNTSTTADVDRIKYGYDRASNRIWRQNPVATANGAEFDEYYCNDGLQRLKNMTRGTLNSGDTGIPSPTFEQCWTIDPTGNWRGFNEAANGTAWTLNQTRAANTVNEITGITNSVGSPWANPAYDAAGNMTTMPQSASPGSSYTATYDAWNRLISLSSSGNLVQQNQFDARTFRTVINSYSGGVLTEIRHCYFSSNWRDIEERVGTATTADRQFVWGARYIDDLVLRDVGTQRFYGLQDANWNVTSVVDTTGTVQERYAYNAYGNPTFLTITFGSRTGSSYGWETLYSGYRFDNSCGLYYVRFRVHHPLLGIWCQHDPLGYRDRQNLYTYVRCRPLNSLDPSGLIGIFFDGAGWGANAGTNIGQLYNNYCGHATHYQTNFFPNNIWANIRSAKQRVCKIVCSSRTCACNSTSSTQNEPVHLFGWSRGAVAAMTLASLLNSEGCNCADGGCPSFSSVSVSFLGLIDPVDTGGYQMLGTEDNIISSNTQNAWVGQATKRTWIGWVLFQTEDVYHSTATDVIYESLDLTHQQSGWSPGVLGSLKAAATAAGAGFECP